MALFADIPRLTDCNNYNCTVDWHYLADYVLNAVEEWELNFDPDFQRGYVWTMEQKVRYVEYALRGGMSGRDIYTNCPGWSAGHTGNYVLVDGKQRLSAVLGWMNNEFPVFGGNYRRDYTDRMRGYIYFNWHVNELATRDAVLRWYCEINDGGTVHDPSEIARVRALMGAGDWAPWDLAVARKSLDLDRDIFKEVRDRMAQQTAAKQVLPVPISPRRKRK